MNASKTIALGAHADIELLREIVASCFEMAPEQITGETLLVEELGADSIDMLNLITELETQFAVEFPPLYSSSSRP